MGQKPSPGLGVSGAVEGGGVEHRPPSVTSAAVPAQTDAEENSAVLKDVVTTDPETASASPNTQTLQPTQRATRIAVAMMVTKDLGDAAWMWPKSYFNKLAYCRRHGYDLLVGGVEYRIKWRAHNWGKINLLKRWLPHYDWIVWMDVDTLITNASMSMEHDVLQLGNVSHETGMIIAADWNGVNTGVFAVGGHRNYTSSAAGKLKSLDPSASEAPNYVQSPEEGPGYVSRGKQWADEFLQKVLESPVDKFLNPLWEEQAGVMWVMDEHSEYRSSGKILVVPQRRFNSYPESFAQDHTDALWHQGDFLAHFPGCRGVSSAVCRPLCERLFNSTLQESERVLGYTFDASIWPEHVNPDHSSSMPRWYLETAAPTMAPTPAPEMSTHSTQKWRRSVQSEAPIERGKPVDPSSHRKHDG